MSEWRYGILQGDSQVRLVCVRKYSANASEKLVEADKALVNKTYKCPAIVEFTFWHLVISKKQTNKQKTKHKCYGEIIKLEAQRKRVIIIRWDFPGSTS